MHTVESLAASPSPLAPHYSRFRVAERLLLTGHSHQAWPDVARDGLLAAFDDAALAVDEKWERAFARAERLREGVRALLGEPRAEIALGASTHELLLRWLSALPLRTRPRLLTPDGEFHTIRRQLGRLPEEGLEVVRLAAQPAGDLAARLAAAVDDRTAAVLVSAVLFETAHIVPHLDALAAACGRHGAELLVDAYHALGALPFRLDTQGLEAAFVIGGGYKYLQLGEGNCFLRLPAHAERLRPAITGWFAEFAALEERSAPGHVAYARGAARFAGSTYDPSSHYRAAAVLDFFAAQGLTPELLRAVSRHQVEVLARGFDALGLSAAILDRDRSLPLERVGGFLALSGPDTPALARRLAARGVHVDARGRYLRLGPAPYLTDRQLETAIAILGEVARDREA